VSASEKIKMGVLDLDAVNVPPTTAVAASEMLRTELFNIGRFTIVDRKNMDKILKEQAFQKTGCTTTDCAVEIGRLLNMSNMATGTLSKVGNTFIITVNLVDVEKGEISIIETARCDNEDMIDMSVRSIAYNLSAKIPVIGRIVRSGEAEVVVDLGSSDNVKNGMKFKVNRLKEEIKDSTGTVIMKEWEEVGEIELTEVQKQASKAKILNAKKKLIEGDIVKIGDLAPLAIKEQAKIFTSKKTTVDAMPQDSSAFDPIWRSTLFPGWGQFYNKDEFKGWLFTILAIGGIGGTISNLTEMSQLQEKYRRATDPEEIDRFYEAANEKYHTVQNIARITAIIWAVNIIDAALSYNPEKHRASLGSGVFCKIDDIENIKLGYSLKW
jgi:LEA14-like dessication related protein